MAAVAPQAFEALTEPVTAPRRSMQAGRRRRLNLFRYVVFTLFGLFFLLPLAAMVRFSLEGTKPGSWSIAAWTQIVSYRANLLCAIEITLELAVITSLVMLVLLVPTMIWIRLRVQWISRTVEFLCLLPLTIPAIVLVVGLAPIYNRIRAHISLSALQLFWAYVDPGAALRLPRPRRRAERRRREDPVGGRAESRARAGPPSCSGSSCPNMWQAILNALLLTSALVLGEFTIAYLLLYVNLQVELYFISRRYDERRRAVLGLGRHAAVRVHPANDPVLCRPPPPRSADEVGT